MSYPKFLMEPEERLFEEEEVVLLALWLDEVRDEECLEALWVAGATMCEGRSLVAASDLAPRSSCLTGDPSK